MIVVMTHRRTNICVWLTVTPVRPPSRTAAADSTYVVRALVPSRPPMMVPTASEMKAELECGMLPWASKMPHICKMVHAGHSACLEEYLDWLLHISNTNKEATQPAPGPWRQR